MKSIPLASATESNTAQSTHPSMLVFPRSATILASYNCSAACEHCCFDSHPGIKTRLSLEEIIKFIDEANSFGTIKLIVFSGGECFLLGKELDIAIKHATGLGLATRCVTNGFWAISEQVAVGRMQKIKEAGLTEINFSTGDFHQKFVPQSNIINGVLASTGLGLPTLIMVELRKERTISFVGLAKDPRISELVRTKRLQVIESPWMPMSLEEQVTQNSGNYVNKSNVHKRKGCSDILNNIVITPTGNMGACCGLTRELIPELNVKLYPENSLQFAYRQGTMDFMKIWLHVEGPEKILAWAASKNPDINWENRYSHHCHACLALYKDEKVREVIRSFYHEKLDEVLLKYSTMVRAGALVTSIP